MFGKPVKAVVSVLGFLLAWTQAGVSHAQPSHTDVSSSPELYDIILEQEAGWIAGLPFASGAIPTYGEPIANYDGKYKVIPYFTNMGLLGLLEQPGYAPVVRNYMDWYFSHLNRTATENVPAGSVFDYVVETDKITETATHDFDSTDSYASTFINLLRKYAEATGDTAYLLEHKEDIHLVAGAMLSTRQSDGLTWAKPAYRVKYLMDNTEVYKGLRDMEWICANVFGDEAAAARYRQHKEEIWTGIQNGLWSESRNAYAYAKMEDGTLLFPDWNSFYADAAAQLFPIWTGVLAPDSERALQLYNTFNAHHPGWPQLTKDDAFPWALLAYTAAIMGDKARVDLFLRSVKDTYIDRNHPWPWYVMESGVTMLAAAHMKKRQPEPQSWSLSNLKDGDTLLAMPYTVSGTAEGVQEVEMQWNHSLTRQTQTFRTTVQNGSWQIALDGLVNGTYFVEAAAKDRFGNAVATASLTVQVQVGNGPKIGKAVVLSDRDVLHREESSKLKVVAYGQDGKTPVDLSDAKIVYQTDRPDLAEIDGQGVLTLLGLEKGLDRISVWAFITLGHDVVKTAPASIAVSHEALSMADDLMDRMAAWIADRQLADGAVALDEKGQNIVPTASNIGMLGLLLRHETIPDVKKYIDWYTAHWNWGDRYGIYGTMDEFRLNPETGQWMSTGGYDSASPNLATFLSLLRAYYEKTGEFKLPQSNLDLMTGGVGIMRSQDADGLMWKLPVEKVKRLSDNALVSKGMSDSVWLFANRFQADGPAAYFKSFLDALNQGIQRQLWNGKEGWYYSAMDERRQRTPPDWTVKQDAAEQLAPIYTGVVPIAGDAAQRLYAAYNRSFPDWAKQRTLSPLDAAVAYTAALLGDVTSASDYLGRLLNACKEGELPAGWTVEHAGYAMLAANVVKHAPPSAAVSIDTPRDGTRTAGRSLMAKGSASGTRYVLIEWREKFGTSLGREKIRVHNSGKWQLPLKDLKRGYEYELSVAALDEWGYPLPGTVKRAVFAIEK
ncbi:hypothetical protein [Cohnella laeviribosi]|uniref:hypothetical protein n=1 Tax=Cohnella laeviribosi TaxID=380174 RepID=UPI003D1A43DE